MTNFKKLARWDADYYKSLPTDECLVCLTEQQVYVLGNVINQITWLRTRWTGDINDIDADAIASEIEYRLAERVTCQTVQQIADKMEELLQRIGDIERTVNDMQNPEPDFDVETSTIYDRMTSDELSSLTVSTETCTTEDKNRWYGAMKEFVTYIHQVNLDALQRIKQTANYAEQAALLLSASPAGLLPFDEAAQYAAFIIEELLDEYEATVDEELLQTVMCDLFCIAVNSGCKFSYSDALAYFAGKFPASFPDLAVSLADVMQFGITGTFSGDDYFYYLCFFQLMAVTLQDHYFEAKNSEFYMLQLESGLNNPDSDWTLFCDACPTQYRLWQWDLAAFGLGDFAIDVQGGTPQGTVTSQGIKGIHITADFDAAIIELPLDPTWKIRSVRTVVNRINGASSPTDDALLVRFRPTANSDVGFVSPSLSGGIGNGIVTNCGFFTSPAARDGFQQLYIHARVHRTSPASEIYIQKVELLFEVNFYKLNSTITTDDNLCT